MANKSYLFRTILTFRGPQAQELRYLNSLLARSKSIEDQQLYIAEPDTLLQFASSCPIQNRAAIELLIQKPWSPETLNEIQKLPPVRYLY
jgi:hypothetical protein